MQYDMMERISSLTLTENSALNVAHIEDSALLTDDAVETSGDSVTSCHSTAASQLTDDSSSDWQASDSTVLAENESLMNGSVDNTNCAAGYCEDEFEVVVSESSGYGSPARSKNKKCPSLKAKDTFSRAILSPKKVQPFSTSAASPAGYHAISDSGSCDYTPQSIKDWYTSQPMVKSKQVQFAVADSGDHIHRQSDLNASARPMVSAYREDGRGDESDVRPLRSTCNTRSSYQGNYIPVTSYAANLGRNYRHRVESPPPLADTNIQYQLRSASKHITPVKLDHCNKTSLLSDAQVELSTTDTDDNKNAQRDRDTGRQLQREYIEEDVGEDDADVFHIRHNPPAAGRGKYIPVTSYVAKLGKDYRDKAMPLAPLSDSHHCINSNASQRQVKPNSIPILKVRDDWDEKSVLNEARVEFSTTVDGNHSDRQLDGTEFSRLKVDKNKQDNGNATPKCRDEAMDNIKYKISTNNSDKSASLISGVDYFSQNRYNLAPSSPIHTEPVNQRQPTAAPTTPASVAGSVTSECPSRWSDFVSEDESYVTAPDNPPPIPEELVYRRLLAAGDAPGPVTAGTAALYRRRLARLEERAARFTPELDACLRAAPAQLGALERLETCMTASLGGAAASAGPAVRRTCFNYLLLDPRVTGQIPSGADVATAFPTFAAAVFYVGKGQQSRPHQHLLEAAAAGRGQLASAKLRHIRAIWTAGRGVVLLIVFHNRLPDEALTREAAMIDALGLRNLTNVRSGDYYGAAKSWTVAERRRLGAGLLHKALRIYLVEGETQLRPNDLGKDASIDCTVE